MEQRLNAKRTDRAIKKAQEAKPRKKKYFTKADYLSLRKKQMDSK
jgi:hypothetical protein